MADDPSVLLEMMGLSTVHPDWLNALEAYVAACEARDKAAAAFDKAEHRLQQREAEMRAVYERLTGEGKAGG